MNREMPGLDPYIKDIFEVTTWTIAIIGGGVAAFSAIHEMRANTRQRFAELRWKRASAAKEILHDIHGDLRASRAVTMMDWSEGRHEYESGGQLSEISYEDVLACLKKPQAECASPAASCIIDSFDWFFYFIDRIEHYIKGGLIDFEDVAAVFKPYAKKVGRHRDIFFSFMAARDYEQAIQFWMRYNAVVNALAERNSPALGAAEIVEANSAPAPGC